MTDSPADTLRTAADKLRGLATAAEADVGTNPYWRSALTERHDWYANGVRNGLGGPSGELAATMHPGVGRGLANLLEAVSYEPDDSSLQEPGSDRHDHCDRTVCVPAAALAVARAILGDQLMTKPDTEQPRRIPLKDLTQEQLDELYDDLDRCDEVQGEMNEQAIGLTRSLARAEEDLRWAREKLIEAQAETTAERTRTEKTEAVLEAFRDRIQDIADEARGGIRQQLGDALAGLEDRHAVPDDPESMLVTVRAIFEGFGRLIAASSRDWGMYRVDAWLWAVILGWDCEQDTHDVTCTHGTLEMMAAEHGWSEETVAKARRYRAVVRELLKEET